LRSTSNLNLAGFFYGRCLWCNDGDAAEHYDRGPARARQMRASQMRSFDRAISRNLWCAAWRYHRWLPSAYGRSDRRLPERTDPAGDLAVIGNRSPRDGGGSGYRVRLRSAGL
jgi:hypothetical protein